MLSYAPLAVLASAYRAADRISSAAETRFEIAAAPSAHLPSAGGRGLPGRPAFAARLVKARLTARGPPAGLDAARIVYGSEVPVIRLRSEREINDFLANQPQLPS